MQRRLEELDRNAVYLSGGRGGASFGGGNGEMLDLGENRNRDWEFLEALFAVNGAADGDGDNNHGGGENQLERRRTMLMDLLSGMSVRMLVEREERRRRERGSRLVALLKETSMVSFSA
jgi:hypothetical protein